MKRLRQPRQPARLTTAEPAEELLAALLVARASAHEFTVEAHEQARRTGVAPAAGDG